MPVCKSSLYCTEHAYLSDQQVDTSYHTRYNVHDSVVYLKHLGIGQYNLPLWCSSLCICMNPGVIHKYLKVHLYSQKAGQQEGLIADASAGSRVLCSTLQCFEVYMCKMAHFFALACWLCSMQMKSM